MVGLALDLGELLWQKAHHSLRSDAAAVPRCQRCQLQFGMLALFKQGGYLHYQPAAGLA